MENEKVLKDRFLNENIKKEGEMKGKYQKFFGWILLILGILIIISALPQQTPSVIDLKFLKINIGTQLDLIRLVIGGILIFIGYKGIKLRWQT